MVTARQTDPGEAEEGKGLKYQDQVSLEMLQQFGGNSQKLEKENESTLPITTLIWNKITLAICVTQLHVLCDSYFIMFYCASPFG